MTCGKKRPKTHFFPQLSYAFLQPEGRLHCAFHVPHPPLATAGSPQSGRTGPPGDGGCEAGHLRASCCPWLGVFPQVVSPWVCGWGPGAWSRGPAWLRRPQAQNIAPGASAQPRGHNAQNTGSNKGGPWTGWRPDSRLLVWWAGFGHGCMGRPPLQTGGASSGTEHGSMGLVPGSVGLVPGSVGLVPGSVGLVPVLQTAFHKPLSQSAPKQMHMAFLVVSM